MNMRAWNYSSNELLPEAFDEYDERHMTNIAPNGLASEIQGILLLRREWDTLNLHQRSEQAEMVMNNLYKACRDKWREDL